MRSVAFVAPSPMPVAAADVRARDDDGPPCVRDARPMSRSRSRRRRTRPWRSLGAPLATPSHDCWMTRGIATITSAHSAVPAPGRVAITREAGLWTSTGLSLCRVSTAPRPLASREEDSSGGFIPIDPHCRVCGLEHVYAAGDATDFAVKHGGIAAQQADTAAEAIAARSPARESSRDCSHPEAPEPSCSARPGRGDLSAHVHRWTRARAHRSVTSRSGRPRQRSPPATWRRSIDRLDRELDRALTSRPDVGQPREPEGRSRRMRAPSES